jgi:hypothetical protein
MLCPNCSKNQGIKHQTLGILPCGECKARLDKLPSANQQIEIIPERIKAERQERADSIEQPHIKGELNKRWIDLWGVKAARERGFTAKEIKNAKYVYDGLRTKNTATHYYKEQT